MDSPTKPTCRARELVERLASLAKIELSEEELESICVDLEKTAEFLKSVSSIASSLDVEPLYYVWDTWGPLRDVGKPRYIDVSELPVKLKDGYIVVPWRGGRIEEA